MNERNNGVDIRFLKPSPKKRGENKKPARRVLFLHEASTPLSSIPSNLLCCDKKTLREKDV
jgi:hypothetical protein